MIRRLWWSAFLGLGAALVACGGPQEKPAGQESLDADPPAGAAGPAQPGSNADLQRGIAYIKNEKFADAKVHLEKAVADQPRNAEAHYYLGLAKEKTGDRPGGEEAYKKALALDPKFAEAAANLAALYLDSEPPRPDEAIPVLKTALAKTPDSAALLQNLGYAYSLKGDIDNASKQYDAAIAKGDSPQLRFAYGAMLVEAKQPDKAAEHLKKALEGAADDPAMLATLGRMLAFSKAFGDCVKAFDRALKAKQEPEWYVRRGTCRHELKDEPGARGDYQAAIKADPKFAAGHYYLGLSLLEDKKQKEATAELEQAVKLGGDTPIAKTAKDKLDSLKGKKK